MARRAPAATPTEAMGMRHVSWVRVEHDDDGAHAVVVGIRHRLPVEVPVSVGVATSLVADGVPLVLVDRTGGR